MIHLADFSSAQPLPDRQGLLASRIRGVHIKCGEGLHDSARDSFLKHAANLLPQTGEIRVGAYHVVAPSSGSPEKQAQNLLKWSAFGCEMMPYMVDVERNRPLGADATFWRDFLNAYIGELDKVGVRYMVYTYLSFRRELEAVGFTAKEWHIAAYPALTYPSLEGESLRRLVLSDPTARYRYAMALSRRSETPVPQGGAPSSCTCWQWGGDANASTVGGVLGMCDRSYYLGDDWDRFWAGSTPF